MQIDIRKPEVDTILFAEEYGYISGDKYYQASCLQPSTQVKRTVKITDTERNVFVGILSEQHAKDLIKALEKAIELGWFE
jgi:hypothetical protein